MRIANSVLGAVLWLAALSAWAGGGENLDRAFFNAVGDNDLPKAKALLAEGARINAREKPWDLTPLLIAPDMSLEMVRFLLARGAEVNAADREGTTVLMRAVHSGDPRIVAEVLKSHPRLEAKGTWNNTALTYAVVQGNPEMVRTLIIAGADVNAERADGMRPLDMAQRRLAVAKTLPPKYGMDASYTVRGMDSALPASTSMMHELPRSVLIDRSQQVLALLRRAHARHGSGRMASREVIQHCATVPHAM